MRLDTSSRELNMAVRRGRSTPKIRGLTADVPGECYCDDFLARSARNVTDKECNTPCNGNSSEFCGAGNRMNLYAFGSTTPSVKPTSFTPPPPGGWFARGCYNDSSAARTLSHTAYLQVPMTVEACTSACAKENYTLAGVEYAGGSRCRAAFISWYKLILWK